MLAILGDARTVFRCLLSKVLEDLSETDCAMAEEHEAAGERPRGSQTRHSRADHDDQS
jgi:hypothetical protein